MEPKAKICFFLLCTDPVSLESSVCSFVFLAPVGDLAAPAHKRPCWGHGLGVSHMTVGMQIKGDALSDCFTDDGASIASLWAISCRTMLRHCRCLVPRHLRNSLVVLRTKLAFSTVPLCPLRKKFSRAVSDDNLGRW